MEVLPLPLPLPPRPLFLMADLAPPFCPSQEEISTARITATTTKDNFIFRVLLLSVPRKRRSALPESPQQQPRTISYFVFSSFLSLARGDQHCQNHRNNNQGQFHISCSPPFCPSQEEISTARITATTTKDNFI